MKPKQTHPGPVRRLAVASKEGIAVSEHFGHAKQFYIYEATPAGCRLVGKRQVEHYCLGNQSSKTAMAGILQAVKDCDAVLVAKIGDGPTEKLAAIGVDAVADYAYEAIEQALPDYMQRVAGAAAAGRAGQGESPDRAGMAG